MVTESLYIFKFRVEAVDELILCNGAGNRVAILDTCQPFPSSLNFVKRAFARDGRNNCRQTWLFIADDYGIVQNFHFTVLPWHGAMCYPNFCSVCRPICSQLGTGELMHNNELYPKGKLKLKIQRLQNFAIQCNDFSTEINFYWTNMRQQTIDWVFVRNFVWYATLSHFLTSHITHYVMNKRILVQ